MICSLRRLTFREVATHQNSVFAPFRIACRIAKSHTKDLKPNVAVGSAAAATSGHTGRRGLLLEFVNIHMSVR